MLNYLHLHVQRRFSLAVDGTPKTIVRVLGFVHLMLSYSFCYHHYSNNNNNNNNGNKTCRAPHVEMSPSSSQTIDNDYYRIQKHLHSYSRVNTTQLHVSRHFAIYPSFLHPAPDSLSLSLSLSLTHTHTHTHTQRSSSVSAPFTWL